MNKLFTLVLGLSLGAVSYGQIAFESDLSSWGGGVPTDWMGSKTSIDPGSVNEVTIGVEHGTSMAQLINDTGSHKRFTTQSSSVVAGETYEIKMWITGADGSELRTAFYDETNDSYGSYNAYLDVFAETAGDLTMLTQTVVIPAGCTDGEFILSIRNTDALVGILVDSVAVEVTTPDVATEVSIYDIQYATDAPYISPYLDELIVTKGIVTGIFLYGGGEGRFFIQDGPGAWNGVYVYDNSTTLELGDSVAVTGTVDEFFELTEIVSVTSIEIISSGNPMPAAAVVSTADVVSEEWEGVLVQVVDAKCTVEDADFGQFEVNDGSGARLVDDEMFSYTPTLNNYYSITGVSFLSFGNVKIFPRMISDIEVTGYAGIEENENGFNLYPNPASDIVTITVAADASVAIYSVTGALVYSANGNVNTIDVAGFDAGIYSVVITQNEAISTERLIVR